MHIMLTTGSNTGALLGCSLDWKHRVDLLEKVTKRILEQYKNSEPKQRRERHKDIKKYNANIPGVISRKSSQAGDNKDLQ